jgi:hypothetical protein
VPDAATAVKIAEAVLIPIYGEKQITSEKPLVATLHNGIWTVVGTLPPDVEGGVALVEISRRDARILRMTHGQ